MGWGKIQSFPIIGFQSFKREGWVNNIPLAGGGRHVTLIPLGSPEATTTVNTIFITYYLHSENMNIE